MAGRGAGKADPKRSAARGGATKRKTGAAKAKTSKAKTSKAASAGSKAAIAALEKRIAALERERDALRAGLEQEQARRRRLEEVYAAARDRISRALDSLQGLIDARG